MRRLLTVLAPLSLLVLATFACEDDGTSGSPSAPGDGGFTNPGPGDPNNPVPAGDAAPTGPNVAVLIVGASGPRAGVRVVFHDAAGEVIETMLTGADGRASSTGTTTPGMATALLVTGSQYHPFTWTALEGGDLLLVHDDASFDPVGSFDVTGTSLGANTTYQVEAADCSEDLDPATVRGTLLVYPECFAPKLPVLAFATQGGVVVRHAFKKGNDAPSDGGIGAVTLGGWAAPASVTVGAAPFAGLGNVTAEMLEIADGVGFNHAQGAVGEGAPRAFATAAGFADKLQASVRVTGANNERYLTQRLSPAANVTFDLAQLLTTITEPVFDATTPIRPVLGWKGATTTTDGGALQFRYSGVGKASYTWTFSVPAGATQVKVPALPPEAAEFLPGATSTAGDFGDPEIVFLESEALASATLRRQIGSFRLRSGITSLTTSPLSVDGLYRATAFIRND